MIKGKGKIKKIGENVYASEWENVARKLPDGEYLFVVCDNTKNRNLPYLSYLFSVVLKYLSDALPEHPSTTALYKYFEDMFAPIHTSNIGGEQFEYCELKSEKASDVNNIIEKIVDYALNEWGIDIPRQEEMKDPENRELYSQAYLNQEADWSSFISSRKNISKDERRIEKN